MEFSSLVMTKKKKKKVENPLPIEKMARAIIALSIIQPHNTQ